MPNYGPIYKINVSRSMPFIHFGARLEGTEFGSVTRIKIKGGQIKGLGYPSHVWNDPKRFKVKRFYIKNNNIGSVLSDRII